MKHCTKHLVREPSCVQVCALGGSGASANKRPERTLDLPESMAGTL